MKTTLLAIALGLGLTACTDNDLTNNADNSSTQTDEQAWEKQLTLQSLLSSVAQLEGDTLPSNYANSHFEASIGTESTDDSGVRLIATTSTNEAYRIYRSITSQAFTDGETPSSTETLNIDGSGTLQFNPTATADRYATLSVNLTQLPNLKEIRFVPASLLGTNGGPSGCPYYQFGDVVKKGNDYWVCVRPCVKNQKGKSHWVTLQVDDNENFKEFNESNCKLTLPTKLSLKQGDGQRMTQNFFNLLKVLSAPFYFDKIEKFDDVKATAATKADEIVFTKDSVTDISYMWNGEGIWDLIAHDKFKEEPQQSLKTTVLSDKINAFYYGYTKGFHLFGANSYNVYNLLLKNNRQNNTNPTLFNTVTPETPSVSLEANVEKDFKDFENGKLKQNWSINPTYANEETRGASQFIVKYRTGAQLQERFSTTADDYHSTQSFAASAPNAGITDILVSRKLRKINIDSKDEEFEPFFAYGDIATMLKDEARNDIGTDLLCIREAIQRKTENGYKYDDQDKENRNALFCCIDDNTIDWGDPITEKEALYITFQLMNLYVLDYKGLDFENDEIKNKYEELSDGLKYTRFDCLTQGDFKTAMEYRINNQTTKIIKVKFYLDSCQPKSEDNTVCSPKALILKYDTNTKKYTYNVVEPSKEEAKNYIRVFKYTDIYRYQNNFSQNADINSGGEIRKKLRTAITDAYNKLTFTKDENLTTIHENK